MNNANPLFSNPNFGAGSFDPSSPFDASAFGFNNGTPTGLDLNQFQNPQFQQRGPSPGFQHPSSFQTNPVIPAKRSRAGEDNVGASPRMPQNQFNASRSQTPQQQQPQHQPPSQQQPQPQPQQGQQNFSNAFAGQPFQPPGWSHLQQPGSSQTSPSPQLQNQPFRPPGAQAQQRGQTNSPAHFPPAGQDASNGNRMQTPQNPAMMAQMRGMPFAQGQMGMQAPPPFSGAQGAAGMNAQSIEMQRQYQARLAQAQQQAIQHQPGNRQASNSMDMTQRAAWAAKQNGQAGQAGQAGNNSQARMAQAQQAQQAQQFVSSYLAWAQKQGIQADPQPKIFGRPVHYFQLFIQANKLGLLVGQNQSNWSMLANVLGYQEPQQTAAAQEIKNLMETQRLASFMVNYMQAVQKRKAAMREGQSQQSPTQQSSPFAPTPQQISTPTMQQGTGPPQQQQQQQQPQQPQTQQQPQPQQPQQQQPPQPGMMQGTPQQRHSAIPEANGISTPGGDAMIKTQSPMGSIAGSQISPHIKAPSLPPAPASSERPASSLNKSPAKPGPDQKPDRTRAQSPTYKPLARPPDARYGGLDLAAVFPLGEDLERLSVLSKANQLGAIDIHALTMALLSGLPMETANSLDTLALVTQPELSRIYDIHLAECVDLLDALLECAENELDVLVKGTTETSQPMSIPNFQYLCKNNKYGMLAKVQTRLKAGEDSHMLRRSAERIGAILIILRNLSIPEIEITRDILSSSPVVALAMSIIKHVGNRHDFLREDDILVNAMKDLLVLLSNLAARVEIPNEEDAVAMLHFLIAFAPAQSPRNGDAETIEFAPYVPTDHQYLPYAVETLAKILARDDPNRTFYKSIFQSDATSSTPCSLLLGAFALSIAPIPDRASRPLPVEYDRAIVKHRAAFFSMGMLAADILASLAPSPSGPGPDSTICRKLLDSDDHWAQNLMHLIAALAIEMPMPHPQMPRHMPPQPQEREFGLITTRGLSMLRKLADKAEGGLDLIVGMMPLDDVIAHGLVMHQFDAQVLRQMVALSRLDK